MPVAKDNSTALPYSPITENNRLSSADKKRIRAHKRTYRVPLRSRYAIIFIFFEYLQSLFYFCCEMLFFVFRFFKFGDFNDC